MTQSKTKTKTGGKNITREGNSGKEAIRKIDKISKAKAEDVYNNSEERKRVTEALSPDALLRRIVSKSKEEIISEGSVKEKALLIALNYQTTYFTPFQPVLTPVEKEVLSRSIGKCDNEKEKQEASGIVSASFSICFKLYNEFKLNYITIQAEASKLCKFAQDLIIPEEISKIISFIDAIQDASLFLKGKAPLLHEMFNYKDMNGVPVPDLDRIFQLKKNVKVEIHLLTEALIDFKSFIEAFDRVFKKLDLGRNFLPLYMEACINDIENDNFYKRIGVPASFMQSHLKERIRAGEKITYSDRERAVFPDFEDIPVSENLIESYIRSINMFYDPEEFEQQV